MRLESLDVDDFGDLRSENGGEDWVREDILD